MPATVNNFIMALNMPSVFFKSLFDLKISDTTNIKSAVSCTRYFANAHIKWESKDYIISLPLSDESLRRARHAAAKLYSRRSKLILKYKVLPFELNYTNAQGESLFTDIVLQEIPQGRLICDCISSLKAEPLFEAIDNLRQELKRLKLRHRCITAQNIIITDEYDLYPTELHNITVEESNDSDFAELRQYVAQHFGINEIPQSADSAKSYIPAEDVIKSYDYVGNQFEGLRVVKNSEGYGYIDPDGIEVIAPQYVWAGDIREGRAEVETANGMGLIDALGNYIIEPHYQIVDYNIKTGISRVKLNDEWSYLDYEGRPTVKEATSSLILSK